MTKKQKKKYQQQLQQNNKSLERAATSSGLMYVPGGQQHGTYAQTFYGTTSGVPTGQEAIFSPGPPLPTQPNLNPLGRPVQWRFPPSYNTFPVDRTVGDPDIPSFQQLRTLAKLYNGITICERAWMDMVPRMKLKIELKPEYIAAGANEKDYQKQISYFLKWFEYPDRQHDIHSWLRMALREQTQIDELYVYKRRKRGGGLYSLEIIAGDQMKPLLNDWGQIPRAPAKAYQQYPWGIPGAMFSTDEMVHYQESPAADTPYGQSRIERIIMLVNQALRKQKKDLAHFTEGNIPQGMMLVPDNSMWTPDQIDAFEQAWNALLAGNETQQVRMRFTQPGMKYQPFEQYKIDPEFDKFILNIAVSVYGVSMQDIAFTEDIHKSNGDSQQNVTYRRTIDPLAVVYSYFFTQIINNDFSPELNGDMFIASFGGYDEEEDIVSLASAYSTLTGAGILGITNAAKILKLPDDPNAPYIGRVLAGKGGPVFLDDMANEKMREAALQAQYASYQATIADPMAMTPGVAGDGGKSDSNEKFAMPDKSKSDISNNKTSESEKNKKVANGGMLSLPNREKNEDKEDNEKRYSISELLQILQTQQTSQTQHQKPSTISDDYRRWRQRAIDDVKMKNRVVRQFTSMLIPKEEYMLISAALEECSTTDDVKEVFNNYANAEKAKAN